MPLMKQHADRISFCVILVTSEWGRQTLIELVNSVKLKLILVG